MLKISGWSFSDLGEQVAIETCTGIIVNNRSSECFLYCKLSLTENLLWTWTRHLLTLLGYLVYRPSSRSDGPLSDVVLH